MDEYQIRAQLKHRFHPQWRDLFISMLEQFDDPRECAEFMRGAGGQIAESADLGATKSLSDLQHALNDYFHVTEWGWVTMDEQEDFLWLTHGGFPAIGLEVAGPERAVIQILEGFYTSLLNRLAGTDDFEAKCVEFPSSTLQPVTIAYGDH
ncbi:MAG: cellulose biosynthesis protein BcsD [Alphaproteobacteria bacterium]